LRTRARGLLAAIILLTATIGLPIALAATIGDPLRSWTSIRAGNASDSDVMAILATVFYLAWVSFVIPVGFEFATGLTAWVTRRPRHEIRLPFLGPQQQLAHTLVSAVLLLLPATAAATAPTGTAPVPQRPAMTATFTANTGHVDLTGDHRRGAAQHPASPATRSYRIPDVGGMRSYWALAEHYLGDGQRWREIWQLNAGRVHADGTVMDTPRRLLAGWTVLIPPAQSHRHRDPATGTHDQVVHPGDTLSGLAAAGGLSDWHQVWADNADRPEPHGQRLTDPNLIRPGWTITLPQYDAQGDSHPETNGNTPPSSGTQHQHPHAVSPPHGTTHAPAHHADQPPAVAPSPATRLSQAPRPGETRPAEPAAPSRHPERDQQAPLPVPLEIGLAAAATLVVLDRARRIAQRRRRPGHRPLPPPEPLRQVEAQLRRDARRAHPAAATVQLAAALTADSPSPVIAVVARDDGAVDLLLDQTAISPPPPFVAVPGGWRLSADATGFGYAAGDTDDPYPALAPIGRYHDGEILIDLAAGPFGVSGNPGHVESYLAGLVAAVAGAPWADRLQIHVPAVLAERIGALDRVIAEDTTTPAPVGIRLGPSDGGVAEPVEPGWCTTPVHLYCGWTAADDIDDLLHTAADPARPVHAVINGLHPATATWTLDGNQLSVSGLPDPVTVDVPIADTPSAHDLIAYTTTAPDVPLGDARLPDLTTDAPPDPSLGQRQLMLLGQVELSGTGKLRRGQILNLLAYLALHRRGVDRHQLEAALWPDKVPSTQTMRNRITEARALVDGAISDGPRWRLDESVTTDYQQFTALATGSPGDQRQALSLIRGRPFTGLDDCEWIDLEGFRSEVEAAIVDLAHTVAERDLANGRPTDALAAARAGLLASRYEERLHRLAIRAAHAEGSTGKARNLAREMRTTLDLDIEPDDRIQPETLALYDEMRAATGPTAPRGLQVPSSRRRRWARAGARGSHSS
jgi:DNA-binding SARP family transcriptional activator